MGRGSCFYCRVAGFGQAKGIWILKRIPVRYTNKRIFCFLFFFFNKIPVTALLRVSPARIHETHVRLMDYDFSASGIAHVVK